MDRRKKALKLYRYIFIFSILAVILDSMFAFFEKGIVRDIVVIADLMIFFSVILQFFVYRYFSQLYLRNIPKEAREEDIREIPPQETFPRDQ